MRNIAAARIDIQAAELVFGGVDDLQHREVAHQIGLRFGGQVQVAGLDGADSRRRQAEARGVDLARLDARRPQEVAQLSRQSAVVDDDDLAVGMRRQITRQHRRAEGRVFVDLVGDLKIVHGQSSLSELLQQRTGAASAPFEALQSPHEGAVALLQAAAAQDLARHLGSLPPVVRTDVAKAASLILALQTRQRRVHAGDDHALGERFVNQRFVSVVAGMSHHHEAGGIGRQAGLEVFEHLFRVPVRIDDLEIDAQIYGCLLGTVDHRCRVRFPHRATRVEPHRHALAALRHLRRTGRSGQHCDGRSRQKQFLHRKTYPFRHTEYLYAF